MSAATTATAAPPRLSIDEFLARYPDAPHVELVKGVVLEHPMSSPRHGKLCALVTRLVGNHADDHDLGHVMSNDSRVRVGVDSVRGGDVIYFSDERLPRGDIPEGILPVVPDLVFEVRSPSDRWIDIFGKAVEYIRADELQQIFENGDELTLPDVLPGFSVAVSRLFD